MKRLGAVAIVVSMCAIPVSAGIVDGRVFADFYQKGYGVVELGGGATSIEDALAAVDGKYVKISAEYYSGSSYSFSLITKFPAPALDLYFVVHFVNGTTSRYFSVQRHGDYVGQYAGLTELGIWAVPPNPVAAQFAMAGTDQVNYIEIRQKQQAGAGTVYIDAIEALNIPPVVSAGPDLTITPDKQATTILQGKITDIGAYPPTGAYFRWQKDGVWLGTLGTYISNGSEQSVPLDLSTLPLLTPGTYTFTLVANDGSIQFKDEMFLTVCSNNSPVAGNDSALTQINSPVIIDVLANDLDADGDPLSFDTFTGGANGSVAIAGTGLSYTPDPDFFGTDSFTYTISDGKGGTATATVTVTVNRPPVAAPDAAQTEVGLAVTIPVLANDLDADGDPLTVTGVGTAANGSVTLNADGTVMYTPSGPFAGQDQFSYTISDGREGTSTAEVIVVVNPKDVLIDIKPGSYPNSINLGSNGVVPLAILSTADFDATTVDPVTVNLAGATVAVRGKGNRYMASNQDVNADGRLDLVLQVETENLDPAQLQDGYATVVGTTTTGIPIIGTDEIKLVPQ